MRRLLTLLLIFTIVSTTVDAQVCTPDTNVTSAGITPDILPLAVEGIPYDVSATILVPADTMIPGVPVPATINFFRLDAAIGLPSWLNIACVPANCQFPPGYSCVRITGQPPLGKAGKYKLRFLITLNVTVPNFGTLEFPDTIDGYFVNVVELCEPDTTQQSTGISPDTLPPLCTNRDYIVCATVTIPPDTTIPGVPVPATINYFRLDSVQGLPEWIQYSCNPLNCTFPPGQHCIKIAGCPPCGSQGRYDVLFFITLNVTIPLVGTLEFPDTVQGYYFDVNPENEAINIQTKKATLTWKSTPGATGHQIMGGQLGSPPIMINTGSATSLVATGLVQGQCYYWRVRPTAGGQVGEWSCWDTFYTCAPPTGLTVTNLTNTTATLNWNSGPANVSSVVAGRPNPGGPSSIVTLNAGTNTSLNVSGLVACQEYVWTVYGNCEGGGASNIATPNFFTTTGCPAKGDLSMLNTIPGSVAVELAPNPATETVKVLIAGLEDQASVNVEIYDMTGKLVSGYNLDAAPYMSELQINTSDFANGVYQVITTTGATTDIQKLIIK
ncbi:MAG: T9SS type A sorting domain-containing protein [Chitinophagales bacterium]|nr:T9SS type A sorting domain-containing protein [Chitinophagales bacterium]